ncbi:hypothetical protein TruAng_004090 [Truncatella angustata]|nr:hypothetical protein TruAng_004090 [Truncatella angustata]
MMTIHFNADLRPVVKDRVGMLHWITDPACSGFIIAYSLSGNQVLISNFDSNKYPAQSWTDELSRNVVSAAIGADVPFEILSYRPWVLSRKVATQYRIGNVILAGDAAHSFPPTGGLGLNTGIADVHNLAYKIAAVHRGWADPGILESYNEERRPIAMVNAAQSVKNGKAIFSFLKTLGTAGIEDIQEARANLLKSIVDPGKQEMINEEVQGQREHFDNLELHIGYVYGQKDTPSHASHYIPKFVPGARLPHAWISCGGSSVLSPHQPLDVSYVKEWSMEDISARKASILDLCAYDSFTVLVGSGGVWGRSFGELQQRLAKKGIKINRYTAPGDFDFIFPEQKRLFSNIAEFASGGCILVRPDQHILAKVKPTDAINDLERHVLHHLGLA